MSTEDTVTVARQWAHAAYDEHDLEPPHRSWRRIRRATGRVCPTITAMTASSAWPPST